MSTRRSSYADLRLRARRHLPRGLFDYIDGGVGNEAALAALRARLDHAAITPRALRSNTARDVGCTLFGTSHAAPMIVAPTAMAGLIEAGGEVTLARAATRHGIPFCLSTQSITSVQAIRDAVPDADIWMQIYLWQDRDLTVGLLHRARAAGVRVAVMTIDTPYGARKPWNDRSGFGIPFRPRPRNALDFALHPRWLVRAALPLLCRDGVPKLGNYPEGMQPALLGAPPDPRVQLRRDLTWADVRWLRDAWDGPLVLKGVLSAEDAAEAARIDADGVVVSSHGARNFDAAPAPIDRLRAVSGASGDLTVLADSGVQSGLDVLRYRLAGASAVMIGRLLLWALAAGGEAGVMRALDDLRGDYVEALDFAGIE